MQFSRPRARDFSFLLLHSSRPPLALLFATGYLFWRLGRHWLRLIGGPENFSFLIPHSSRHPEIPFFATEVVFGTSKQHSARWAGWGLPFFCYSTGFFGCSSWCWTRGTQFCLSSEAQKYSFSYPIPPGPLGSSFFATEVVSGLLSSTFLVHAQIPATSLRAFQRFLPLYRICPVLPWILILENFSFISIHYCSSRSGDLAVRKSKKCSKYIFLCFTVALQNPRNKGFLC